MYVIIVNYKTCFSAETYTDACREFLFWWISDKTTWRNINEVNIKESDFFETVEKHVPEYEDIHVREILIKLLLLKEYEKVFEFVSGYEDMYVIDVYNTSFNTKVNDELFQAKLLTLS